MKTLIIMAEGKAITFYRCNLLIFFYFVSIDERLAMGSQPNLASIGRRGVDLQINQKKFGRPPQIWGT